MMRWLPWVLLVVLVIWALRKSAGKLGSGAPRAGRDAPNAGEGAQTDAESMISCAHCQVYFPASEAVRRNGQDFCSLAHAEAH
jgi:uncharacterized protein